MLMGLDSIPAGWEGPICLDRTVVFGGDRCLDGTEAACDVEATSLPSGALIVTAPSGLGIPLEKDAPLSGGGGFAYLGSG